MARTYYYVSPATGGWKITVDGLPGQQWDYATKDAAVNAAATAAKKNWETKKRQSGVRIQLANGQWQDERTYGNDPFPPRG